MFLVVLRGLLLNDRPLYSVKSHRAVYEEIFVLLKFRKFSKFRFVTKISVVKF